MGYSAAAGVAGGAAFDRGERGLGTRTVRPAALGGIRPAADPEERNLPFRKNG
jgi:hypothetical protein